MPGLPGSDLFRSDCPRLNTLALSAGPQPLQAEDTARCASHSSTLPRHSCRPPIRRNENTEGRLEPLPRAADEGRAALRQRRVVAGGVYVVPIHRYREFLPESERPGGGGRADVHRPAASVRRQRGLGTAIRARSTHRLVVGRRQECPARWVGVESDRLPRVGRTARPHGERQPVERQRHGSPRRRR